MTAADAACLHSPLLTAWAAFLARLAASGCRLLELEHCPPAHLGADGVCATAGWLLSLAAALLLVAALVVTSGRRLLRWMSLRDGTRMVAVAVEVARELRKAQPGAYPQVPHMFGPAPPGAGADPLAPQLCGVCRSSIPPGAAAATSLACCFSCGLLVHDKCARKAGKTCRPLCCAGGSLGHHWKARGTVLEEEEEVSEGAQNSCLYCGEPAEASGDVLAPAEPLWRCTLCCGVCHVSCFCETHPDLPSVSAKLRSLLADSKGGAGAGSVGGEKKGRVPKSGVARKRQPAGQGIRLSSDYSRGTGTGGSSSSSSSDEGGSTRGQHTASPMAAATTAAGGAAGTAEAGAAGTAAAGAPNGTGALLRRRGGAGRAPSRSLSSSFLQALAGVVGGGGPVQTSTAGSSGDSGYSSGSESDGLYDARLQRRRWQRRRRRRLLAQDVARLDECTLGPLRRSVLPPTAVRPALRSGGSSEAKLDLEALAAEGCSVPSTPGGRLLGEQDLGEQQAQQQAQQQQQAQHQQHQGKWQQQLADRLTSALGTATTHAAAPTAAPGGGTAGTAGGGGAAGSGTAGGRGGRKKSSSWWQRLYRPKHAQWQDYRLEELPPGCKPLLVFVNTKSGPQVGAALRRRFLRALHPLQVVELPRQKPDPALLLFAGVAAHVRILVVGGDGSVAWVLNCLEELKAAQAAQGNPDWRPPPVAVLPLGTGNDLARCLGWGSGHGAWHSEGVGTMLAEVQHAAPLLIDRWSVSFAPPHAPQPPASTPKGKLVSVLRRHSLVLPATGHSGGGTGSGTGSGGGGSAPKPAVVRQMNNYLGIGVDAKVALEFHQMREQFPSLFFSQLGNKFWYTSLGGKDIVSGHACCNLAQKLQVSCDGRPVALPSDIEGLMVLNINSYMGGVDLWRNSYSLPGYGDAGSSRRSHQQSMFDGRVEIVAVYGSWHLGQLQVGLSRAVRLGQGHEVTISTITALPMQIDGEPWVQAPAAVAIGRREQGLVLRRVQSKPLARMMQAVSEVLEESERRGSISAVQHHTLMADLSSKLQPLLNTA